MSHEFNAMLYDEIATIISQQKQDIISLKYSTAVFSPADYLTFFVRCEIKNGCVLQKTI